MSSGGRSPKTPLRSTRSCSPATAAPAGRVSRSTRCRSRRPSRTGLHLDVISDTFDAETERLPSLGAQRLRDLQRDKARWTTFADIEGNEFDLIAG
jgi:hypothetical protein